MTSRVVGVAWKRCVSDVNQVKQSLNKQKKKGKHKRAVLLVGFDVVVSNPNWTKRFFVHFSISFPLEVNALLFTRTNIHKHQVTVLGCRAKKDHLIRTEEERGLNEKVKKEQWVGKTTNKEIWKKLHIDQ